REWPIDGQEIAQAAGGSEVQVEGTNEGWAAVRLDDGRRGFIDLKNLTDYVPADRVNDRDVVLTLYREPELTEVRQVTINAQELFDNSHVTFTFEPLLDSSDVHYRFTLTSPGAQPGNAVTFRYAPN